jgi:uncharacterized membrane protein YwzB
MISNKIGYVYCLLLTITTYTCCSVLNESKRVKRDKKEEERLLVVLVFVVVGIDIVDCCRM